MGLPFSKRMNQHSKLSDEEPIEDKPIEAETEVFDIIGELDIKRDTGRLDNVTVFRDRIRKVDGFWTLRVPDSKADNDKHSVKQEPVEFDIDVTQEDDAIEAVTKDPKSHAVTDDVTADVAAVKDPAIDEPKPYDKYAPVHGVIDESHEPMRWYPYASDLKLEDLADRHEIRCGEHVAFFDPADASKVDELFTMIPVPEKSSDKKTALIRLRTTLEILKGIPPIIVYKLEKVTRMFHDVLESAPGETVTAADLEACLGALAPEPTRYGPFPDLQGAVGFMHLPVLDNKIVGMAIKKRYYPDSETPPPRRLMPGTKNSRVPNIKFAHVSIWNKATKEMHDENDLHT